MTAINNGSVKLIIPKIPMNCKFSNTFLEDYYETKNGENIDVKLSYLKEGPNPFHKVPADIIVHGFSILPKPVDDSPKGRRVKKGHWRMNYSGEHLIMKFS